MAGTNSIEEKKGRGRPKSNDPKMKFDNVRLKTSTLIDVSVVAEALGVSESVLVQTVLESEMPKYKKLLSIDE